MWWLIFIAKWVLLPLVSVFEVIATIIRCSICLTFFPIYLVLGVLCALCDRKDLAEILISHWVKCVTIGTKYEKEA